MKISAMGAAMYSSLVIRYMKNRYRPYLFPRGIFVCNREFIILVIYVFA